MFITDPIRNEAYLHQLYDQNPQIQLKFIFQYNEELSIVAFDIREINKAQIEIWNYECKLSKEYYVKVCIVNFQIFEQEI